MSLLPLRGYPRDVSFLLPGEAIADVADGFDSARRLVPQLGPKPAYVNVDRAGAAEEVVTPNVAQQRAARAHLSGPRREIGKQLELLVGQVDQLAAHTD